MKLFDFVFKYLCLRIYFFIIIIIYVAHLSLQ